MASSRRRIAPFSGESEVESDLEDLEKMNGILEDTELINKISDEDLKKIVFEEDLSKIKIKSKEETQTNEVSQKIDVSPKENDGIQGKEKVDKEILRQTEASFRIEKLPVHEEDFATKSGVKYTSLTKIESGVIKTPSVQTMAKIAKALGVSVEELIR